jgi:hypothetical protein
MSHRPFRRFSFRGRGRRPVAAATEVETTPADTIDDSDLFLAAFAGNEIVLAAGRYLEWVDALPSQDDPPEFGR